MNLKEIKHTKNIYPGREGLNNLVFYRGWKGWSTCILFNMLEFIKSVLK